MTIRVAMPPTYSTTPSAWPPCCLAKLLMFLAMRLARRSARAFGAAGVAVSALLMTACYRSVAELATGTACAAGHTLWQPEQGHGVTADSNHSRAAREPCARGQPQQGRGELRAQPCTSVEPWSRAQ